MCVEVLRGSAAPSIRPASPTSVKTIAIWSPFRLHHGEGRLGAVAFDHLHVGFFERRADERALLAVGLDTARSDVTQPVP